MNGCTASDNCWTGKAVVEKEGLMIDNDTQKPLPTCGYQHAEWIARVDIDSILEGLPSYLAQNNFVPNRLIRNQAQYQAATMG